MGASIGTEMAMIGACMSKLCPLSYNRNREF
jgi:hypothetical protein